MELLLFLPSVESCGKMPLVGGDTGEVHVQGPVLLGLEGFDLSLPLADQPGGHRLDPAGGEPPADLLPQQGGELVAHDAVQDAPGLLGVHQVLVNGPWRCDGIVDHLFCDLVEGHPVGLVIRDLQKLLQVPGDGFSLPVRVSGQKNLLAALSRLPQIRDHVLLSLDRLVVRREPVLHIHPELALGKVPNVPHGCLNLIAGPQIFSNGLGLGRRLYNH